MLALPSAHFREARHDAPAWLAWGPTLAHYLVWVDPDGGPGSAILLDPTGGSIGRSIVTTTAVRTKTLTRSRS